MIVTIRFKLFSALKGLSMVFYVGGAEVCTTPKRSFGIEMHLNMASIQQLTMLPLILAGQKYLILSIITYILVAVLNVVLIVWLLPETIRSPAHKLSIFKAAISPAVVLLRQPWLTLALFVYSLTPVRRFTYYHARNIQSSTAELRYHQDTVRDNMLERLFLCTFTLLLSYPY